MTTTIDLLLRELPSWVDKSDGSNTYEILKSFADEFDIFSAEADNVHTEIFVNGATGSRLDDLAKIFKLSRKPNESDNSFRNRVKAFWPGFSGAGTIPAIISTVQNITGLPSNQITITEDSPPKMKFTGTFDITSQIEAFLINDIIDAVTLIKAAGVWPRFVFNLSGDLTASLINVIDTVVISIVSGLSFFLIDVDFVDGTHVTW
jgi:hypothetical protein